MASFENLKHITLVYQTMVGTLWLLNATCHLDNHWPIGSWLGCLCGIDD